MQLQLHRADLAASSSNRYDGSRWFQHGQGRSSGHHWAQAVWNSWLPEEDLQASVEYARNKIDKAQQPWSVVTGPAAAFICTLGRLQWRVVSAVMLITDEGKEVDLRVTPPLLASKE